MSKIVKKSSLGEIDGDSDFDSLTSGLSRDLQIMDDFVWINNSSPESTLAEGHLDNFYAVTVDSEQNDSNETSSEDSRVPPEANVDDLDGQTLIISDLDKEFLMEQLYWEQVDTNAEKVKLKYPASQRLTQKEFSIITNNKTIVRDPAYYQFDKATTDILRNLLDRKHLGLGPYHNVVGNGENSVVIYAYCPLTTWVHFVNGHAVKVYKLGSDVKKNSLILKRVQREYDHLKILQYPCYIYVPSAVYKNKNVLVMDLIGTNQETAPSINCLPLKDLPNVYSTIVSLMDTWYKKLHLVHGKLCAKNIRYYRDNPTFIGWAHSVRTDHPLALKKLLRDCYFVTKFFERRQVQVKSTEELFRSIAGEDKLNRKLLELIYGKNLWDHCSNPNRANNCSTGRQHLNTRFK